MNYKIEWEDEGFEYQQSPLEAVKQAVQNICNGETLAFTATDLKTNKKYSVDLSDDNEEAVVEIT